MRIVVVGVDMDSPIASAYAVLQQRLGRQFTHDERLAFFTAADFIYQLFNQMAQPEVPEELSQQVFAAIVAELRCEFEPGEQTH